MYFSFRFFQESIPAPQAKRKSSKDASGRKISLYHPSLFRQNKIVDRILYKILAIMAGIR